MTGENDMEEGLEKITFTDENGQTSDFYILEQTKLNGINYLLVIDSVSEEETEALILKEVDDTNEDVFYCLVEEEELQAISSVFEELLEDIEIEYSE